MLGTNFQHDITRKVTGAFGTLFNNIYVVRYEADGTTEHERFKVPLRYGPKEKWFARTKQEPTTNTVQTAITLPMLSFFLESYEYDSSRKLTTVIKQSIDDTTSDTVRKYSYAPVPYNLNFSLFVGTTNISDGNAIIEQILPWFTPEFTITIKTVPEINAINDCAIMLNSTTIEDSYEGNFEERRALIWTLSFTAQTYFYGPVYSQKIIKKAMADSYVLPGAGVITASEMAAAPRSERTTVQPNPTTAKYNDAWTYDITTEWFDDGKRFNPVTGVDEDF